MLKHIEGRHSNEESTESLGNCSKSNPLELYPSTVIASLTIVQGNTTELLPIPVHARLNKQRMSSSIGVLERGK